VVKKRTNMLRKIVPAMLAMVAVAALAQNAMTKSSDAKKLTAEGATPTATPDVTINGKHAQLDDKGQASVTTEYGTKVDVSGAGTAVKTPDKRTHSGSSSNSSVNISVNSSNEGGSSWNETYVHSSGNSDDSSGTSYNSTQVFSTGSSDIDIDTE